MSDSAAPPAVHEYPPAALQVPVDLFVSKKHPGLSSRDLGFTDSSGKLVYRVDRNTSKKKSSPRKRVVLDASGNPLISIYRHEKGSWQGFKRDDHGEKDLIFRAQRTVKKFTKTELDVFLVGETLGESPPDFKAKGFPFRRSCTIYKDGDIVAQTSLMYKLHQIYARRNKYRLTMFPCSIDNALLVALIVIFFDL